MAHWGKCIPGFMDDLPTYNSQEIKFAIGCANLAKCGFYGILLITSRKCSYTKLLIGKIKAFLPAFWEAGGETEGAN
jgi:hypothetical protein